MIFFSRPPAVSCCNDRFVYIHVPGIITAYLCNNLCDLVEGIFLYTACY